MQRRRLTRRQRRRRKAIKETVGAIIAGLVMGGLLVAGFAFCDEPLPEPPEHWNQVEYCGQWWDKDDYEAMMKEREEYLASEQAEEQAFIDAVKNAQARAEESTERPQESLIKSKDWDANESYMLAKIAMAEAEGEDTEGKALVITVVLNRVWSDEFPNSIEGVITEEKQFTAYENGRYDRVEPSEDCYKALRMVENGWDESQGATYFERTSTEETWHNTSLHRLFTHGNHTFYKEAE